MKNKEYNEFSRLRMETDNQAPFKPLDISTKSNFKERTTQEIPKTSSLPPKTSVSDIKKQPYFTDKSVINDNELFVLDKDWARQAFLVSDIDLSNSGYFDSINRYWSSASNKFLDTRIGGNIGVNARPQFTRYSDIRDKGRITGREEVSVEKTDTQLGYGMGRYYSEAIDDNSQTIYLRFGVPQYSSLTNFFSKAFDPAASRLARTGTGPGFFFKVGLAAGTIAAVVAFPVMSTFILGGRMLSYFFTRPTSKYYTLKPTMFMYWSAVESLVSSIAVNKGLIPRFDTQILNDITGASSGDRNQTIGSPFKLDNEYLEKLHTAMPDLFNENYRFDVKAIANRAQRIANMLNEQDYQTFNVATNSDFTGKVQSEGQAKYEKPKGGSFSDYVDSLLKLGTYVVTDTNGEDDNRIALNPKINEKDGEEYGTVNDKTKEVNPENPNKASFSEYFDAEFREGSGFAVFKVDHTGAVSEAFSNSTVESDISQKFNGMSSSIREAKFSLQGGNITGSAAEAAIKGVLGAAVDVVKGVASGVTYGLSDVLSGVGSGFIDIPKHWQSSSANLPRSSYTMQLISPYGNVVSQMQNIFIPLAMILAGALPISTGKQSYTSPFICQLWDRGRQQIQIGMIESLSITRGTCNLPFTNKGNVLAIDVSFTVADLSSIMHMPISTGGFLGVTATDGPIMDEDNILFDYLAVLAGQDIYSQYYAIPKARLNFAKGLMNLNVLTSPAHWASLVHDSATTGFLQKVTLGAGNLVEALTAGSNVITNNQR